MWRRAYLLLVLVRLYFALSPSYLHPDENFQGPEVIAGQIFTYPTHLTWEFTSDNPVRSVFPLWPVYGLPMLLLRSVWSDAGDHHGVSPAVVFYTLRLLMFVLSFVLEDWAIHELVQSPRHRRIAVLLVASSYVTWTYQTHTFSNSIETLLVLWSLVLIQRIVEAKQRSSIFSSAVLAFLVVLGVFNRITFPAFLFIPGLRLLPHFLRKPLSLLSVCLFGALTILLAISLDTSFYNTSEPLTLSRLLSNPTITPLNNFIYNSSPSNLALHGTHPYYTHLLANLPLLLGPAYLLLFALPPLRPTLPLISALSGILVLSLYTHQEARFLIPTIPLILSSVRLPLASRYTKPFLTAWILFNALLGTLMGVYHQGGVVPTQLFLAAQPDATRALWWRTYSPPIWLLDGKALNLTTTDLQGTAPRDMIAALALAAPCIPPVPSRPSAASRARAHHAEQINGTYLVAPLSSVFLDAYIEPDAERGAKDGLQFERVWEYRKHFNLDDLDFGGRMGVWGELGRVVGRRGLGAWRVERECHASRR